MSRLSPLTHTTCHPRRSPGQAGLTQRVSALKRNTTHLIRRIGTPPLVLGLLPASAWLVHTGGPWRAAWAFRAGTGLRGPTGRCPGAALTCRGRSSPPRCRSTRTPMACFCCAGVRHAAAERRRRTASLGGPTSTSPCPVPAGPSARAGTRWCSPTTVAWGCAASTNPRSRTSPTNCACCTRRRSDRAEYVSPRQRWRDNGGWPVPQPPPQPLTHHRPNHSERIPHVLRTGGGGQGRPCQG